MNRYAVFGILDDRALRTIRAYQRDISSITGNTLALRFPVHVTLRGPFRMRASELGSLIGDLHRCCRRHEAFDVVLDGPVVVDPDLCWFEVKAGSPGFSRCRDLHILLEDGLNRQVGIDDVSANHKLACYRPHVTLGWDVNRAMQYIRNLEPATLTGTVTDIALVSYPAMWPAQGAVRVIESVSQHRGSGPPGSES